MVDTSKEAIEALISKGWPDCPQDARKMISALRAELDAAKAEIDRLSASNDSLCPTSARLVARDTPLAGVGS